VTLRGDVARFALGVAIIALAGATAFGLWHVVVGGMLNGNPRAAGFGAVLAIGAGSMLAFVVAVVRRRRDG
jgi:hypothetical protein